MKLKVPFLIPALFSVLFSFAEKKPTVKIHAYSQAITTGKNPDKGIINENGIEEKGKVKPGIRYLIYFEHSGSSEIKPDQIWIQGTRYTFTNHPITKTPVELEDQAVFGETKKEILVQETSNKVLHLVITGIAKEALNGPASIKKLVKSSDLVVGYIRAGKRYYKAVKKIKMLEPVAAM